MTSEEITKLKREGELKALRDAVWGKLNDITGLAYAAKEKVSVQNKESAAEQKKQVSDFLDIVGVRGREIRDLLEHF